MTLKHYRGNNDKGNAVIIWYDEVSESVILLRSSICHGHVAAEFMRNPEIIGCR